MVKNQEQAQQILEMMDTALEASAELYHMLESGKGSVYEQLAGDLHHMLVVIEQIAPLLKEEEPELDLPPAVTSARVSLERIYGYGEDQVEIALNKLQYELIPLIENMRLIFYYWGMVYPDETRIKKYYEEEIGRYVRNIYMEQAEAAGGRYEYDLSIAVLAYNKLEYTKLCVESLLKHMPKDIRYELILINNGSSDGTKEYFETIHPDKQIDIAVNGGGSSVRERIAEGKYLLCVSNDVVVTEHAIDNLYQCISMDNKIAWAVAATTNISNLQDIPLSYKNMEELQIVAAENNQADAFRREQRVRLCNPIDIRSVKIFQETMVTGAMLPGRYFSFPDDHASMLLRRRGYKLMLVKDAYCHHYGSITIHDETQRNQESEKYGLGRINFVKQYGIDPWGKGACYEYNLFETFDFDQEGHVNMLGVNCGIGSNPLKIKECLKEKVHNTDVTLYNYTDEIRFIEDLKGISDIVHTIIKDEVPEKLDEGVLFDYIIIESELKSGDYRGYLMGFYKKLSDRGVLIAACKDPQLIRWAAQSFPDVRTIEWQNHSAWWLCCKKEPSSSQ